MDAAAARQALEAVLDPAAASTWASLTAAQQEEQLAWVLRARRDRRQRQRIEDVRHQLALGPSWPDAGYTGADAAADSFFLSLTHC